MGSSQSNEMVRNESIAQRRLRRQREVLTNLPWGLDDSSLLAELFCPSAERFELGADGARKLFEEIWSRYESSGSYLSLQQALAAQHHTMQSQPKNAIAFGIGRIASTITAPTDWSEERRLNDWKKSVLFSMLQLVLFVIAVKHLSSISGGQVCVYVQDPDFTAADDES